MSKNEPPEIQLGDRARDTITGFEGIVVARTEWLNGCWRLALQGKVSKDGKPEDAYTFDSEQIELLESRGHKANKETGGPRPSTPREGLR